MSKLSALKSFVINQRCIPWTVSDRYARWLEETAYSQFPSLYRLLRFGRLRSMLTPLTHGPLHHFFGYYDKSPWNESEDLVLTHEACFHGRPPTAEDRVGIAVIEAKNPGEPHRLHETAAWSWQEGAMLQWHPNDPRRLLLYNDRRGERFVAVVGDVDGREHAVYERPVYAVCRDGNAAFSVNFARLQNLRPG